MDVVVAGGGVAGLEGLLALRALAGDQVDLTLVAPDPEFTYRPLAVAEPFALGHAYRVPLSQFAQDAGAELVIDAASASTTRPAKLRLRDGGARSFDALLVAPGARAVLRRRGRDDVVAGRRPRDLRRPAARHRRGLFEAHRDRGAAGRRLAAARLRARADDRRAGEGHGQRDVTVTVVTPERRALSLFGDEASEAVAEELRNAGVELKTGAVARREGKALVLEPAASGSTPSGLRHPAAARPGARGLPADEEGFIVAGDDARVEGCERTWAAGDAVVSPLKFGGLATHQARRAAAGIAHAAGVGDAPDPGEPVIHGRLLVGRGTRRLGGRGDAEGAPLWWPQGKIAGEYLPRWLTEHGVTPPAAEEPDEGITVHRPISEVRGPELEYLHGLAREFRSADPAIASLGRHMREARER